MFKSLFASKKRPFFRGNGRLEPRKFDLSGCILEISMPAHDYGFPEEDRGSQFNLFDINLYSYNEKDSVRGLPPHYTGFSRPGIFLRKWDSFGHILRGSPVGFLQCSAVVCDISKMETTFNCFNKKFLFSNLEPVSSLILIRNDEPSFSFLTLSNPFILFSIIIFDI